MNIAQVDAIINQAKMNDYGLFLWVDENEEMQTYIIGNDQICSIDRNPPGLIVIRFHDGKLMCIDDARIAKIMLIPSRKNQI